MPDLLLVVRCDMIGISLPSLRSGSSDLQLLSSDMTEP